MVININCWSEEPRVAALGGPDKWRNVGWPSNLAFTSMLTAVCSQAEDKITKPVRRSSSVFGSDPNITQFAATDIICKIVHACPPPRPPGRLQADHTSQTSLTPPNQTGSGVREKYLAQGLDRVCQGSRSRAFRLFLPGPLLTDVKCDAERQKPQLCPAPLPLVTEPKIWSDQSFN